MRESIRHFQILVMIEATLTCERYIMPIIGLVLFVGWFLIPAGVASIGFEQGTLTSVSVGVVFSVLLAFGGFFIYLPLLAPEMSLEESSAFQLTVGYAGLAFWPITTLILAMSDKIRYKYELTLAPSRQR